MASAERGRQAPRPPIMGEQTEGLWAHLMKIAQNCRAILLPASLLALSMAGCAHLVPIPKATSLAGIHSSAVPNKTPLVGTPKLFHMLSANYATASPFCIVAVPLCNQGPEPLQLTMRVVSGASEVAQTFRGCTVNAGFGSWMGLGQVRNKRSRPICLRLSWQKGKLTGSQTYTITTKSDNAII